MSLIHQPKAFYVLFFVELWERFGYYGMQALLVLYMVDSLEFTDIESYSIFGAFAAMIYITPIFGGYLSDRYIGYHRSLILGASLLLAGYTLLAIMGYQYFYFALGFIIAGSGFFKTCPTSLLAKVYKQDQQVSDSGFTLFYMSINIGSLISMLLSGFIAENYGWNAGFAIAAIGMAIGLFTFILTHNKWVPVGSEADFKPIDLQILPVLIVGSLLIILGSSYLLQHISLTRWGLLGTIIGLLIILITVIVRSPREEARKLVACLILIALSIIFFALYFQAPMSINLFIERNVNRELMGIDIPTASFQALNPFWIVILAPILAVIYNSLAKRKMDLSIPTKFTLGIIIMGFGFWILQMSTQHVNEYGQTSSWWIFASYGVQDLAELLVSAIGLSMVAKLAPPRLLGLMMGTWFLGTSVAAELGSFIAEFTSVSKSQLAPFKSLIIYGNVFLDLALMSIAVGVLALLLIPLLKRLMRSSETSKA